MKGTLATPSVTGIFTASAEGMPMVQTNSVLAVIGLGLFMDRYATHRGTYSSSGVNRRQITLMHAGSLAEANRLAPVPYRQRRLAEIFWWTETLICWI